MKLRSIKGVRVSGKRVLLRTDFDVPIKNGKVVNDARIQAAVPTINYLLSRKAGHIIIISHAGRPHGKKVPSLSLRPVALHLGALLGKPVAVMDDCITAPGTPTSTGRIAVCENLRFNKGEETNNTHFARKLAAMGDLFVNDALADLRGNHASMAGIPRYLPSYCGLHVEKEIQTLHQLLQKPKHPFLAIIGGGKPDKLSLINALLSTCDTVFAGGILGNILLKARGSTTSKVQAKKKEMSEAKKICRHPRLMLPVDAICAKDPSQAHTIRITPIEEVPATHTIFDIGPATLTLLFELISTSKTVLFAGTPGMYENPHFATGTNLIAKWMARSRAETIIAGGDTAAAVSGLSLSNAMTHVSTGGGAAVALIEGKKLPGLEPLIKKR